MGTLIGHYRHHTIDDPFYLPGLMDLTSHIDFSAIAQTGIDAQLELIGYTNQAQFLINCGITDILQRLDPDDIKTWAPQAGAVQKLLSPAEMGELFKVIGFGKGVRIDWQGFAHEDPGLIGRTYDIKLANQWSGASITAIKYRLDVNSMAHESCHQLALNDIAVCNLALGKRLVFDSYVQSHTLGGFILVDKFTNATVAAGMIRHNLRRAQNVHRQILSVTREDRERLNGHRGMVIWFTGLSGAGKSTLANALETALHASSATSDTSITKPSLVHDERSIIVWVLHGYCRKPKRAKSILDLLNAKPNSVSSP